MLIRHLLFFVTLADEMHFGKAADICHVTQPTLSAAIRKLEEDLNTVLIIRGHRYLGLTTNGQKVLEWGRKILIDYKNMRQELVSNTNGLSGILRLGVVPSALPFIPTLTDLFQQYHPNVEFNIQSMTTDIIDQNLDIYGIDAAITYIMKDNLKKTNKLFLYDESYVFICPKDHLLAQNKILEWKDALAQPLCLLNDHMHYRKIIKQIASSLNITVNSIINSDNLTTIYTYLCTGKYCSIIPHTFLNMINNKYNFASIPLKETKEKYPIGLITSAKSQQLPMTDALLTTLKNHYVFESKI